MNLAEKSPVTEYLDKPRYLTKSRFKIGLECPTKLYYTHKPEQYVNQSLSDSFLEALAQGGYQVGELAKHYYPGGVDIKTLNIEEAIEETEALLKQDKVTIFEAAIRFQNLFIRVDILQKNGDHLDLIEVKAKSFNPEEDNFMKTRGRGLTAKWAPYLHDVAFQHYVISNAYPVMNCDAHLMLTNKAARAETDGLNTKFRIVKAGKNRKEIEVADTLSDKDLEPRLLNAVNVNDMLSYIYEEELFDERGFESHIDYLASIYENNSRVQGELKKACTGCEFRCSTEDEADGKSNGHKECWSSVLGWNGKDPLVTEIWNFRSADKLMAQQKYKLSDLDEDDIAVREDALAGLSQSQRQWMQVEKAQNNDSSAYLDTEGLRAEMVKWTYPLHFIDFETSATALPFTKGMSPYEGIAFQFSHHIVHKDGRVEHAGEFLDTTIGHLPNFDFIKALKIELETDNGTIFRYSNHENTYLNQIFWQLKDKSNLPLDEVNELCEFIKTITHSTDRSPVKWRGERDMVDLWQLVKRYYYDPYTRGSNSIKFVLPAVLNSSDFLKNKYSQPIYGTNSGISSRNFNNQQWVKLESGKITDPYRLLPTLFGEQPENIDDLLSEGKDLADGGAAMTAYAKMQFTEMSDYEREELRNGLLKYCELDTLAMVMIFEAWREWLK